jgi:hypothetical protein
VYNCSILCSLLVSSACRCGADLTRSSMPHRDNPVDILQPQGSSRMGGSCIVESYLEWCWAEVGIGNGEMEKAREPRELVSCE